MRKWPTSWVFILFFFHLFSSFCCSYIVDLLLGLLQFKEFLRKHLWHGKFLPWSSHGVVEGNLALTFSLKFLSIFMYTLGLIDPVTLIWVSLKISFLPAEDKNKWCQFSRLCSSTRWPQVTGFYLWVTRKTFLITQQGDLLFEI